MAELFNTDTEFQDIPSPLGPTTGTSQVSQFTGSGIGSINGQVGDLTFQTSAPVNGVNLSIAAAGGVFTFSIVGVGALAGVKSNLTALIAPTVADDDTQGYSVGSMWQDTVLFKIYMCSDNSTGAAVWTALN